MGIPWTEAEISTLKRLYPNTNATTLIPILGRTKSSINSKAAGLKIKSNLNGVSNKKYTFNEDFFSKPNLLNSYWAGFIAADGCIEDKRHGQKQLKIGISSKDIELLSNLKKDIQFTGDIKQRNDYIYLSITSDRICDDLKNNFNITPRKSLTLKPPKGLTNKQKLHFIIGLIDGDGHIGIYGRYRNKLKLNIVGTKAILNFVRHTLKSDIIVKKYKNIYTYTIYATNAKSILIQLNKIKIPKLNRKWNKVEQIYG